MRVLIVLPNDILGGAEKILKIISTEMANRDFHVDVLFLKKSVSGGWNDIAEKVNLIFSTHEKERNALGYLVAKIKTLSKQNNYEYTFSSNTGINGLLGLLRKFKILKTNNLVCRESTQIMDRFSGTKRFIFKTLYKYGYGANDLVIYQTSYMKKRLETSLPFAKKWKNAVIPNPISLVDIKSKKNDEIVLPTRKDYIVAVGRLIKLKGIDLLIRSMENISEKFDLVIVGDGEELNVLKELSVSLGLSKRVFFEGYKKNPYPYMNLASACVISSRVEGFPNTLLQMMAVNENVVSTLCAGDIDKLKGVVTCQIDNVNELSKALNTVLNYSDKRRQDNRGLFNEELQSRTPHNFLSEIIRLTNKNA